MANERAAGRASTSGLGRIALVDADSDRGRAARDFLLHEGYAAQVPGGLAECVRQLEAGQVDLVVVVGDSALLEKTGAVATLRRAREGGRVPIVLVLTGPPLLDPAPALVDALLQWPIQLGHLAQTITAFRSDFGYLRPAPDKPLQIVSRKERFDQPLRGTLHAGSFAELFAAAWRSGTSGVIRFKSGGTWRSLELLNGFVVGAQSNLVTEHLLRYLLRLGYISADSYRQLLPRAQREDWRPGASLLRDGLIEEGRLQEAMRRLATEIVIQCFRWDGAAYRFEDRPAGIGDRPVDLNPFELYAGWLADPSEHERLEERFGRIASRGLIAGPSFREHVYFLRRLIEILPDRAQAFDGSATAASLLGVSPASVEARAAVVALVELGALVPVAAELRPRAHTQTADLPLADGRKLRRIRQMVEEDQARVARADNPYTVLGLSRGAALSEVRSHYQRFCRFYRLENFERIGDPELLASAQQLLEAFRAAAVEVLGEEPQGPPFASERRATTPPPSNENAEAAVLAEAYYDDGTTYLRLGDLAEANAHFARAQALDDTSSKYLTYHGWCLFQLAPADPEQVKQSKEVLLAALRLDAKNDRALYFLGCIYEQTGRVDRAIECWQRALRINSGNFDARSALRRASG